MTSCGWLVVPGMSRLAPGPPAKPRGRVPIFSITGFELHLCSLLGLRGGFCGADFKRNEDHSHGKDKLLRQPLHPNNLLGWGAAGSQLGPARNPLESLSLLSPSLSPGLFPVPSQSHRDPSCSRLGDPEDKINFVNGVGGEERKQKRRKKAEIKDRNCWETNSTRPQTSNKHQLCR